MRPALAAVPGFRVQILTRSRKTLKMIVIPLDSHPESRPMNLRARIGVLNQVGISTVTFRHFVLIRKALPWPEGLADWTRITALWFNAVICATLKRQVYVAKVRKSIGTGLEGWKRYRFDFD